MGVPKKLTEMQKRFCKILVYGDEKTGEPVSQTEAAIQAGYSRGRARTEGAELMNATLSPLVVAYKNKLDQERQNMSSSPESKSSSGSWQPAMRNSAVLTFRATSAFDSATFAANKQGGFEGLRDCNS